MPVPEGLYDVPPMGAFGAWRGHGRHRGVDQYAPKGTPIRARMSGTMLRRGFNPDTRLGFGHWMEYAHDDGHVVTEAHMLGPALIGEGGRFTLDQLLARVSDTGNAWSVGPHSHVEVRTPRGFLTNPLTYFSTLLAPPSTLQPDPEETLMRDRQIHYIKNGKLYRGLLNTGSGFFMPWTGEGDYANDIAKSFETNSSVEVTESLFLAFQRACEAVRAAS